MKLRASAAAEVARWVNHAIGQSEPGPTTSSVSDRSDSIHNLGRWPCIGLHAGALEGTSPHRQPRLDRWTR